MGPDPHWGQWAIAPLGQWGQTHSWRQWAVAPWSQWAVAQLGQWGQTHSWRQLAAAPLRLMGPGPQMGSMDRSSGRAVGPCPQLWEPPIDTSRENRIHASQSVSPR